nr:MAG TPA: hypothetical protein [Bacteriophage sp.]
MFYLFKYSIKGLFFYVVALFIMYSPPSAST